MAVSTDCKVVGSNPTGAKRKDGKRGHERPKLKSYVIFFLNHGCASYALDKFYNLTLTVLVSYRICYF